MASTLTMAFILHWLGLLAAFKCQCWPAVGRQGLRILRGSLRTPWAGQMCEHMLELRLGFGDPHLQSCHQR